MTAGRQRQQLKQYMLQQVLCALAGGLSLCDLELHMYVGMENE